MGLFFFCGLFFGSINLYKLRYPHMSWSVKRQLLIIFLLLSLFGGLFGVYYFLNIRIPVSCTDGKQNQGELGVDCGGPCKEVCESEILPLVVEWTRPFKLLNGKYDVASLVVNRNNFLGIPNFKYKFSLFDDRNIYISEKEGSVFINPSEKVLVFVSGIDSGKRTVARAFLEYSEKKREQGWQRVADTSGRPKLSVENENLIEGDIPRLYADIVNSSPYDIKNIDIAAVVYDAEDNAIAASKTVISNLRKDTREQVVFTWPEPFPSSGKRVDILPRIDYISGNN
jgi:hypothetical protein